MRFLIQLGPAPLEPLEVFKTNRIHALPVEENGELVGIVTTYDIICALAEEEIKLEDYNR